MAAEGEPLVDVVTWRRLNCDIEDGTFEQQYRKSFESKGIVWASGGEVRESELGCWSGAAKKAGGAAVVRAKKEVMEMLARVHTACTLQKQKIRAGRRAQSAALTQDLLLQLKRTGVASIVQDLSSGDCQKRIYQCLLQISRIRDYLERIRGGAGDGDDPFSADSFSSPGLPPAAVGPAAHADPFGVGPPDHAEFSPLEPGLLAVSLSFLDAHALVGAGVVNRTWRRASEEGELWEDLCVARWGADNLPIGAADKEQGWKNAYFVGCCRSLLVHLDGFPTVSFAVYPDLRVGDLLDVLGADPRSFSLQSQHFSEQLQDWSVDWGDAAQDEVPCHRIARLRLSGMLSMPCCVCELVPAGPRAPPPPADAAAFAAGAAERWRRRAQRARPLLPPFAAQHADTI